MELHSFFVEFYSTDKVYKPGQVVEGVVCIETSKPEEITGIEVRCRGFACVSLERTEYKTKTTKIAKPKVNHTEIVREDVMTKVIDTEAVQHAEDKVIETETIPVKRSYISTEDYFNAVQSLVTSGRRTLPAGNHAYKFCISLPENIPSSFERDEGYVRYILTAIVKRNSCDGGDYHVDHPFTVNKLCDLNAIPLAKLSVNNSKSETFDSQLKKTVSLKVETRLVKTGYVPGEVIECNCLIENNSGKEITGCDVELRQYLKFKGKNETESSSRIIVEKSCGEIRDKCASLALPLLVPSVFPSGGLDGCSIIDLYYKIIVTIRTGSFSSGIVLPMGVIIGNVPIREKPIINNKKENEILESAPLLDLDRSVTTEEIPQTAAPVSRETPPVLYDYSTSDEEDSFVSNGNLELQHEPLD